MERDTLQALDPAGLRRALERSGYAIEDRFTDGCECLLRCGPERWAGTGRDPHEALLAALRAALPSHLARELLAAAITADETRVAEVAEVVSLREEAAPEPSPAEPLPLAASSAPISEFEPDDLEPDDRPPPAWAVEQALDELREIRFAIETGRDEVAAWSPERQRVQLLHWIAEARSIQDATDHAQVANAVFEIAKELTLLTGIWWPGNITAFQLAALPESCAVTLACSRAVLSSWEQVARSAIERLQVVQAQGDAEGLDERGWKDAASLDPRPEDPAAELAALSRRLEAWTWPLRRKPSREDREHPLPPLPEVLEAARLARWLRGATDDLDAWGAVIGRLRFLGERFAMQRAPGWKDLEVALDARTIPEQPWCRLLGRDPETQQLRRERKQLVKERPQENDPRPPDELLGWLRRALACTALDLERLTGLVQPMRALVLAVDVQTWAGRRERRRLTQLQALLRGESEDDGGTARDVSVLALPEEEDVAESSEVVADRLQEILDQVLPHTRGKRALLVTNRADPDQDRVLDETFGFARLDHEIAAPRKLDALADRLRARKYDLVLSVTGFQSHKTDAKLASVAREVDLPYVRVNKGRRVACVQALYRELVRRS